MKADTMSFAVQWERSQYSLVYRRQIGDAQNRCYHQMCIHGNALEKPKTLDYKLVHTFTVFENEQKCQK